MWQIMRFCCSLPWDLLRVTNIYSSRPTEIEQKSGIEPEFPGLIMWGKDSTYCTVTYSEVLSIFGKSNRTAGKQNVYKNLIIRERVLTNQDS